MKKSMVLSAAALLFAIHATAQTSNVTKVGVLNVFRAIVESTEGKQANDDFQKKYEAKRVELERRQKEIQDLQKQLSEQGRTLNDESRSAMAKSIEAKSTDLQRLQEDAEKEFTELRSEILNRIGNKLAPVVQQYAKEMNFMMILDSSNQSSQVIYHTPTIDVTDDIIKRYDSQHSSAAPAAPPAPASPAPPAKK
ncbi:MAG: OmpH family outer membrane protein [Acidobacteriota bacterium]